MKSKPIQTASVSTGYYQSTALLGEQISNNGFLHFKETIHLVQLGQLPCRDFTLYEKLNETCINSVKW